MQATGGPSSGIEGRLRAVTKHVPFRAAATIFNVVLSTMGRDGRAPHCLVSDGVGDYPAVELNVSSPFHRRMFYFPRAYCARRVGLPFRASRPSPSPYWH